MTYGSPENLDNLEAYLTHIKGGKKPSEKVLEMVKDHYRQVGGKTPMNRITKKQAALLQKLLDKKQGKNKFKVYLGMKHWHPYIKEAVENIKKDQIKKLIAVVLAPHYSKMSIGGYKSYLDAALKQTNTKLKVKFIKSWHKNKYLISCIIDQIKQKVKDVKKTHIIFTAHSLPERIKSWNDPYEKQLRKTSGILAKKLKTDSWSFSFQSAGQTAEKWLGPDILESLTELKKRSVKNILICPIGFVVDNLEILYDIDIESKNLAKKLSLNLERVESRNTHPLFIRALYNIILNF